MENQKEVEQVQDVITIEDVPDSNGQENIRSNYQNRRGAGNRGSRFGGRGGLMGQGGGPGGNFRNMEDRGDNRNHRNDGEFRGRRGGRGGGRGGNMGGGNRTDQDQDRPDRNNQDHRGGGQDYRGGMRGMGDKILEKYAALAGPTYDLPAIDTSEKKFSGRNRLYIGNINNEVSEEDITEIFKPFGETAEIFLNKEKNFAFIKVDYHSNAEKAKRELDGTILKGRNLKIRFAPNSATIKVKNLSPYVTNELLHYAFSPFGEVEKAIVCVDERGKPTGEGIVDFSRKGSAMAVIRKCNESCFFLTSSLQPVIVESYEIVDDNDGYSDKNINKKHHEFGKEREQGPRFSAPGSFEHEYGMRWKAIFDLHQQKEEALKKELFLEKEKLEAQMEYARYEHETEVLRDQLRARELDKERQKREWEMKQRQAEEERQRTDEQMRRAQEEMDARLAAQQEELRRRQQENSLFMQAHTLDNLLEQTEQAYDTPSYNSGHMQGDNAEGKQFMSSYERHNRFEGRDGGNRAGGNAAGGNRGHWVSDNRRDDFPNKRRRF